MACHDAAAANYLLTGPLPAVLGVSQLPVLSEDGKLRTLLSELDLIENLARREVTSGGMKLVRTCVRHAAQFEAASWTLE